MNSREKISFIDHPAITGREGEYETITVNTALILRSYRASLFSFEWLDAGGHIKNPEDLPEREQAKQKQAEDKIRAGNPFEKAILGIGMLDNIEFGCGRADFLTLARLGLEKIPVHIRKSHKEDFQAFLADIQ